MDLIVINHILGSLSGPQNWTWNVARTQFVLPIDVYLVGEISLCIYIHIFTIYILYILFYIYLIYLFLTGGQLLYNIVLVAAVQRHESSVGLHMSCPS